MILLKIYLIIVFTAIAGIHVYWAFGGKRGLGPAIPENSDGPLFESRFAGTFVIALIFFTGSIAVLMDLQTVRVLFLQDYLYHLIAVVFALRAIGEFKYVGIFKKIKHSEFALYDSRLYIPLCLSISLCGWVMLM